MKKKLIAVLFVAAGLAGVVAGPAAAKPSDNASCVGKARSAEQGPGDKDLARAFAKAMGQNGNGVGAFVVFVNGLEGDACPAA